VLFENVLRKFEFHYKLKRKMDTWHENPCTFVIVSHRILLRMRNISDKIVEKIITHSLCSVTFFFSKIVQFIW